MVDLSSPTKRQKLLEQYIADTEARLACSDQAKSPLQEENCPDQIEELGLDSFGFISQPKVVKTCNDPMTPQKEVDCDIADNVIRLPSLRDEDFNYDFVFNEQPIMDMDTADQVKVPTPPLKEVDCNFDPDIPEACHVKVPTPPLKEVDCNFDPDIPESNFTMTSLEEKNCDLEELNTGFIHDKEAERTLLTEQTLKRIRKLADAKDVAGLTELVTNAKRVLLDFSSMPITSTFDASMEIDPSAYQILLKHNVDDKKPIVTAPNGDCLFNAISIAFSGDISLSKQLRLASVIALFDYKEMIKEDLFKRNKEALKDEITDDSFFDQDYFEQISRTASENVWSGIYQITAVAYACQLQLHLIYPPENGSMDDKLVKLNGGFFPTSKPSFLQDRTVQVSQTC